MWANHSDRSLKMSYVSESLRSLTKNEWPWAIHSHRSPKMSKSLIFFRESLICSLFRKNRAIPLENRWVNSQPCNLLFFGERPELITHGHSFLVSNLSYLLISRIKKEEMSKSLVFFQKTYKKSTKKNILVKFCWANRSFLWAKEQMSNLHI